MLRLLRTIVRTSIHEIVKKEKEIHASFAAILQTAKVMAMVYKFLGKMAKGLNLYNKIL